MTVKSKKKYPTVKATNGAVFELRTRMTQISAASTFHGDVRFAAPRKLIRDGIESRSHVRAYFIAPACAMDPPSMPSIFPHQKERGSAMTLGCMNFSKSDAAKIRKWAKGGK